MTNCSFAFVLSLPKSGVGKTASFIIVDNSYKITLTGTVVLNSSKSLFDLKDSWCLSSVSLSRAIKKIVSEHKSPLTAGTYITKETNITRERVLDLLHNASKFLGFRHTKKTLLTYLMDLMNYVCP